MARNDTSRRFAAIRQLARRGHKTNGTERLARIAELANGGGDLNAVIRGPKQPDLGKRLEEGQASRSPMANDPKPEKEEKKKKRTEKTGHDRKEKGGETRGEG